MKKAVIVKTVIRNNDKCEIMVSVGIDSRKDFLE